jgi:ATP-binding cassette subfamily B protein
MIARHYKRSIPIQKLRDATQIGKEGVSMLGIAEAAESCGFKTLAIKVTLTRLKAEAPLPVIVHWNQNHFVVVYKITGQQVFVADPAVGLITYTLAEFESLWASTVTNGEKTGVALLLEPTASFYEESDDETSTLSFGILSTFLIKYKRLFIQLALGLLIGSVIQLVLPFLTQSIVDTGIQTKNLNFIYLVLIAQLMLFLGRMSVEFIRAWILLHISTRINLSILSGFLSKLLRLPISYFESKMTGDILQRINDHRRIEQFLTGTSLNVLFSLFNLVIYAIILAYYHLTIFGVFAVSSIIYGTWIVFFLGFRRKLDHKRFSLGSQNQSSLIQLVQSLPELKLNNAEVRKRWDWENIQVREFKLNVRGLSIQQYQQSGAMIINEGKNIIVTFLAATAVVHGQMSLGAMMAMQYIIGQLNSPIEQLVQFLQQYQDAKISLERMNEVNSLEDELPKGKLFVQDLPQNRDITIRNLSFTYAGAGNEPVLKNLNLVIPEGKITAIVGGSGSGKTTLLKLLLKFYPYQKGEIRVGNTLLDNINPAQWRASCGTVMQDGYIFSDTIANNIAVSDEKVNTKKLMHAVEVANIQDFITDLPLSYNTKIGAEGNGISGGQKQRLLIARAVYKNPDFILFDEATSSLDANNESIIMRNLGEFFKGKTVIIVAHRLSTVKNADQIIVLQQGEVVETGTHATLTQKAGRYFELVKNQLELAG